MSGQEPGGTATTTNRGGDEACPPPTTAANGTPAPVQGNNAGDLPPLATVVHTSYAPAPATGTTQEGEGEGEGHGTEAQPTEPAKY